MLSADCMALQDGEKGRSSETYPSRGKERSLLPSRSTLSFEHTTTGKRSQRRSVAARALWDRTSLTAQKLLHQAGAREVELYPRARRVRTPTIKTSLLVRMAELLQESTAIRRSHVPQPGSCPTLVWPPSPSCRSGGAEPAAHPRPHLPSLFLSSGPLPRPTVPRPLPG